LLQIGIGVRSGEEADFEAAGREVHAAIEQGMEKAGETRALRGRDLFDGAYDAVVCRNRAGNDPEQGAVGLDEQIRRGKFDELLAWLHDRIHIYGHKYDPQDLVQKATGSKIDSAAYVRYLTRKYTDIYGL
jgi:hypothetical protein